MIFIVESGSTKSDWILLEENSTVDYSTMGYNPCFHSTSEIINSLKSHKEILDVSHDISKVFFYGAGCSSKKMNQVVENALESIFKNAKVTVDHDLKACAYATYRGGNSISCILGTGSNSCFFNGEDFKDQIPALGYVLGDEGSGSYFGKKLLSSFLYNHLPKEIHQDFVNKYSLNSEKIIEAVYVNGNANVYLASFMPFIASHKENPYFKKMIKEGFKHFISIHVKCYDEYQNSEVHFVGSISSIFEEQLKEAAQEMHVKLGQIIRKPAKGLVEYHRNYLL